MRHPSWASTLLVRRRLIGLPDGGPLSSSSGMAGRPTAIISASGSLSPVYISVPTVSESRLGDRGVKGDSQSRSLTWWLHQLLIRGCWSTPGEQRRLTDGWGHLRSPWHQTPCAQELPLAIRSPPSGRSVWQGCDRLLGYRGLPLKWVPNGNPWWRWHQSGHTSQGGTQSSHPPEEAVVPYPGVCSIIWLHEVGGVVGGTPAHLQFVPR